MFWERFYQLCESKGKKPNTVAKELGFSSAVCTQWKKGQQNPSTDKVTKIAEYFGVTIKYLLGQESEIDKQLDGVDFALLSETENLTMEQKEDVLKYIRFIKADSNKE